MASTYSGLKVQLMTTGENAGTWGDITNTNLGTALEEAIAGTADVTFDSGNVTLTLTDTNTTQTARHLRLNLVGTTGGARDLIVPDFEKSYIVNNTCADDVTVKTVAGTGAVVPAGKSMMVYNDGTNVSIVINSVPGGTETADKWTTPRTFTIGSTVFKLVHFTGAGRHALNKLASVHISKVPDVNVREQLAFRYFIDVLNVFLSRSKHRVIRIKLLNVFPN